MRLPPREIVLGWEQGLPVSLDGVPLAGPELVARLGELVGGVRDRAEHPRRRDRARHQGPDRLRGRRGAAPHRRASRAGEAGAHQVADVLEGPARPLLRRPAARGPVLRSRAPGHRGADHQLAARVTGETRVRLAPGRFQVVGTRSPHSMMDTVHRHLRRGEPSLDRRRGPGLRARRRGAVAACAARGGHGDVESQPRQQATGAAQCWSTRPVTCDLRLQQLNRNGSMVVTTRVRLDRISSSTRNARSVARGDRRRPDRVGGGLRARGADPGGQVHLQHGRGCDRPDALAPRGRRARRRARHPARAARIRRRGARRTSPSATPSRCSTSAASSAAAPR